MADPEKLVVGGLISVFLGGSFFAAVWVLDSSLLPVAGVAYLLVAVLFFSRIRRAEKLS